MDLTDTKWRKSSYSASNGGNCVELADAATGVAVRDSKDPDGPRDHDQDRDQHAARREPRK
ncbi:hypothetical protein GCM10023088_10080 [Actinomadura verrucosospora]|uniref:DUF397 domain-containing protein n=1 Tax=Actinomadura verrucosospora TaxID=46165 RepID=UPI0031F0A1D9